MNGTAVACAVLIYAVAFAGLCAYIAEQKHLSQVKWGITGALLGVIALIGIALTPAEPKPPEQ